MKKIMMLIVFLVSNVSFAQTEQVDVEIKSQGIGNCEHVEQGDSIGNPEYLSAEAVAIAASRATLKAQLDCDGVLLNAHNTNWSLKTFPSGDFSGGTVLCQLAEATFVCRGFK